MVDLPKPDFGLVTAEAPRSSVSGDIFKTQPQASIAPGLAALAEGTDALAKSAAEAQGREDARKAVIVDPETGKYTVADQKTAPFIMGAAGKAYQAAFLNGVDAAAHNAVNRDLGDLGQQFKLDPQGFEVSSGKYIEGLRSKYPGLLGDAMMDNALRRSAAIRGGLIEAKGQSDVETAKANLVNALGDSKAVLQGAAFGGLFKDEAEIENSDNFKSYADHYRQMGANPLFGVPKSTAERQIQSTLNELRDLRVQGQVRRIADEKGVDAATAWAHKELVERDSTVPMAERQARFAMAQGEIGRLTEQQRADQKAANATAQTYIELYRGRTPPSDEQVELAIEKSRSTGDVAGASALRSMRDAYQGMKPTLGVGAQGMAAATIGRTFNPAAPDAYLDRTKSIENPSGNPAAVSPTGATGDFQFTSRTAAQYGLVDPTNPKASREAARKLAIDNAISLKAALGRDPTEAEVYLAHQQGAAGAQALLQHPDMNAVQALAQYAYKGDVKAADQAIRVNGGNPSMTAGQFALKWVSKFNGAASPIRFTREQLAADPGLGAAAGAMFLADRKAVGHFVDTQVDAMTTMVKMGLVAPNATDLANVMQLAQQYPEHAPKVQKLAATVEASRLFADNAATPTPVSGAALVQQSWQMAQANPSIYSLQRLQASQEIQSSQDALLKQDPRAYGARVGWNAPATPFSQLSTPDQIGPALAQRRQASVQIASRLGGAPADYMFGGSDVGDIHNMLTGSDGATATKILGALAGGLKPEEMVALAGDKNFTGVVAGLMRSGDPQKMGAAYAFMDGQWRKNPVAFEKEYGSDVVTKMHVWQDKLSSMNQDMIVKEVMKSEDLGVIRAKDSLRADADKAMATMTPEQAAKVFGSWVPFMSPGAPVSDSVANGAAALRDDYRQLYRDYYAESNGDKSIAEKRSLERMQQKWGASKLNDGRLMAYPPDKYYPKDMNGKQDYFRDQLRAEIAKHAGETGIEIMTENGPVTMPMTDAQQRSHNIASGAYAIVADNDTMADLAAHRLPSYRVVVLDKRGQFNVLEQGPNQFMRFRADPEAAMAPQRVGLAKEDAKWRGIYEADARWKNETSSDRRERRRKMREED
jgi:hypothetical protein